MIPGAQRVSQHFSTPVLVSNSQDWHKIRVRISLRGPMYLTCMSLLMTSRVNRLLMKKLNAFYGRLGHVAL